jgi:hypothetical protein
LSAKLQGLLTVSEFEELIDDGIDVLTFIGCITV